MWNFNHVSEDEWYRFVDLALGGPDAQKRKEAQLVTSNDPGWMS